MGSLENITSHIIETAEKEALQITQKAENEAAELKKDCEKEISALKNENSLKIARECERLSAIAESDMRQCEKDALLLKKREIIENIIEDVKNNVKKLSQTEYLDILKNLLQSFAFSAKGELIFSKHDKELLNEDILSELKKNSSELTISEETAPFECGFIIRNGKTEQNCSVEAIFEDKYNRLVDLVNRSLSE